MKKALLYAAQRLRSRLGAYLLLWGDLSSVAAALLLSLWLYFDSTPLIDVLTEFATAHAGVLAVSVFLYPLIFHIFRLYQYAWRFASLETLWGVIGANTTALLILTAAELISGGEMPNRAVLVMFWMFSIALVGGTRVLLRMASLGASYGRQMSQALRSDTRPRRVVILGAGPAGARVVNAIKDDRSINYIITGLLDDAPERCGTYIRNTRVLGPLSDLHKLLADRAVDEVIIALPEARGGNIREYAMACRKREVPVKLIPNIRDVLNGKSIKKLEHISVEDLLRRPQVCMNLERTGQCIAGSRVMVTGAGGSIGSELCRQILALEPAMLILLGHGENSIHTIHSELCRRDPESRDRLRMVIASVSDAVRMDQIFRQLRPQVVFHAAAHKHVPIMEDNLLEAVHNNVLGTDVVADCCGRYDTRKMVLVSTDKAVQPSSIMGATKWLCEQVLRAAGAVYSTTTYVTVRFGNVLGSRGSVVPIFHEQIERGGPVCVTDPQMTRYFMLIPEAVQLVLQAGSSGGSGDLYVLDMGEPVRIDDLARDMIRLCGFEPNRDISITYTGMRPGEKLHEYLTAEEEQREPGPCEGLFAVRRPNYFTGAEMRGLVDNLRKLVSYGDPEELRALLEEVVPCFGENRPLVEPPRKAEELRA